jgi:hypothetical protein
LTDKDSCLCSQKALIWPFWICCWDCSSDICLFSLTYYFVVSDQDVAFIVVLC